MPSDEEVQPRRSTRTTKVDKFAGFIPQKYVPSVEHKAKNLFNPLVLDYASHNNLKVEIEGTEEQLTSLRIELESATQIIRGCPYPEIKRFYPAGESRAYSLLHALSISLHGVAGFDTSPEVMLGTLDIQDYRDVIEKQQPEIRAEYEGWWKRISSMHPIQALAILKTHEMSSEANCTFKLAVIRPVTLKKAKTAKTKTTETTDPNVMKHIIEEYELASVKDMPLPNSGIVKTIWLYHNAAGYGSAESCFSGLADQQLVTDALLNIGPGWKAPNSCTEPESSWKKERIPQYETLLRELSIWPGSTGSAKTVAELAEEKGTRGPKIETTIKDRIKVALVFYFGKATGEKCYSDWEVMDQAEGNESAAGGVTESAGLKAYRPS